MVLVTVSGTESQCTCQLCPLNLVPEVHFCMTSTEVRSTQRTGLLPIYAYSFITRYVLIIAYLEIRIQYRYIKRVAARFVK